MPGPELNPLLHHGLDEEQPIVTGIQKPPGPPKNGASTFVWEGIQYLFAVISDRVGHQLTASISRKVKECVPMRGKVSPWKLILDSGATVHFFCNKYLLQNIRNASNNIKIHCGGKSWDHSCVGDLADELKNLPLPQGEILYTKEGIGNLVSMGRMIK